MSNHLNSVEFILDSAGKVINEIVYDSFGSIVSETHPGVNVRYGFTGRDFDKETGLGFNRTRYYDFVTGTFLSVDRLGFEAGDVNLYRYVGNTPTIYVDPSGMFWEVFLGGTFESFLGSGLNRNTLNNVAGFVDENINKPVGQFIADNPLVEDAVRIVDSVAVGVSQTANLAGFDIRSFREDIYGEGVNDNLNEAVVTVSTAATLVLGGYALSGLAAGSLGKVAATSVNTGLFNAGFGLTTQLLLNGGDSRELDYNSLRLDFAFGTLGDRLGFGVTARVGGGFATRFAVSTAFEGTFAGFEQVGRNFASGERWNQGVPESIISSILFQGASEALSNPRQVLQVGRRLWKGAENLADDFLGIFGGPRLATANAGGAGRLPSSGNDIPVQGNRPLASSNDGVEGSSSGKKKTTRTGDQTDSTDATKKIVSNGGGDDPRTNATGEVVYVHRTANGDINYIGITDNPSRRAQEHRVNPEKTGVVMEVITKSISHDNSRTIEARLIRGPLEEAIADGIITGTEPIAEQLQKAGLLNKNRGRIPERWVEAIDVDDFLIEDGAKFNIETPKPPNQ